VFLRLSNSSLKAKRKTRRHGLQGSLGQKPFFCDFCFFALLQHQRRRQAEGPTETANEKETIIRSLS
jgi:hypothetical protein